MRKKSVFTEQQKATININEFIFHVIIAERDKPRFLNKVTLTTEQLEFFKDRFVDASTGTRYLFIDKEHSNFHKNCSELLDESKDYVKISETITSSFNTLHGRSANDGIFIVSTVNIEIDEAIVELVFLIKMDHRSVYQYKLEDGQAIFEEIINTVVEDPKAMQKVAIVDLSSAFEWDILAFDRTKSEGIADYFQSFLTAKEMEPASTLTRNSLRVVKRWARRNISKLPKGEQINDYTDRATDYLLNNDPFDSEDYISYSIGQDGSDELRKEFYESLKQELIEEGIYGSAFSPRPNSITGKKDKNKLETEEGVYMEWSGSAKSKHLEIPESRNKEDNLYHIIVKSNNITRDVK